MTQGLVGAAENFQVYLSWKKGKTLEDFAFYIHRRKNGDLYKWSLNRRKINNELKIGSAINQNKDIRTDLEDIEDKMRDAGLLPPDEPVVSVPGDDETEDALSPSKAMPPAQGGLSASERSRLSDLEEENVYLREELKEKNAALKRYGLIDRFLTDTMRWPR